MKRLQHQRAEHAEDRGGGADAYGEREHSDERETAGLGQGAQRESEVGEHAGHWEKLACRGMVTGFRSRTLVLPRERRRCCLAASGVPRSFSPRLTAEDAG